MVEVLITNVERDVSVRESTREHSVTQRRAEPTEWKPYCQRAIESARQKKIVRDIRIKRVLCTSTT